MSETPDSEIDSIDEELLREIERRGRVTPSELARLVGSSKAMVWRRLRKLEFMGLVKSYRLGGVVIFEPALPPPPHGIFRIGILRASEYPYIMPLARRLRARYRRVEVKVYDEAYRLATDLAAGRLHAAMIPAVTALLVHRASKGAILVVGGGSRGGAGIIEGGGGDGHVTTMASTMEMCAVAERLPGPRVYASSGEEILRLVASGKVKYGVVWEPYLSKASELGLKVRACDVPVCCLLTVHRSLEGISDHLSRIMAESVSDARRGLYDVDAYSNLIGVDRSLVAATVKSYELLEEPPIEELKKAWEVVREAAMPGNTVDLAVKKPGGEARRSSPTSS